MKKEKELVITIKCKKLQNLGHIMLNEFKYVLLRYPTRKNRSLSFKCNPQKLIDFQFIYVHFLSIHRTYVM